MDGGAQVAPRSEAALLNLFGPCIEREVRSTPAETRTEIRQARSSSARGASSLVEQKHARIGLPSKRDGVVPGCIVVDVQKIRLGTRR
jgi:hypothetical protein